MAKNQNRGRREFLKQGLVGLAGLTAAGKLLGEDKPKKPVKPEDKKKKVVIRTLGKTGLKLPVVSMGVMNADNPNLVRKALESGIVLLDTAWGYQQGRNEEMIGSVIKDFPRDLYMIATKIPGPQDRETGLFLKEATAESFLEKFETSLKRLQLKYVDILYLHNVSRRESALYEPFMKKLQQLKKEGKTRFIGVTVHRNEPEVIQAAIDSKAYDVVLTAYNFRQPHVQAMNDVIAKAAAAGIGMIAMKTQAGVYADKEKQHPINMKAALKWALQNENITTAIPGFTTFDQMEEDLSVMANLSLTDEEKKGLQGVQQMGQSLYCAQCERCLKMCPRRLEIPVFMRAYMYAYGYRNLALARETLQETAITKIPCGDCSSCQVHCVMGFAVREKILDVARVRDIPADLLV